MQTPRYHLRKGTDSHTGAFGTDLVHSVDGLIAHFPLREDAQAILDRIEAFDFDGYTARPVGDGQDPAFTCWAIRDRDDKHVAVVESSVVADAILQHLN